MVYWFPCLQSFYEISQTADKEIAYLKVLDKGVTLPFALHFTVQKSPSLNATTRYIELCIQRNCKWWSIQIILLEKVRKIFNLFRFISVHEMHMMMWNFIEWHCKNGSSHKYNCGRRITNYCVLILQCLEGKLDIENSFLQKCQTFTGIINLIKGEHILSAENSNWEKVLLYRIFNLRISLI